MTEHDNGVTRRRIFHVSDHFAEADSPVTSAVADALWHMAWADYQDALAEMARPHVVLTGKEITEISPAPDARQAAACEKHAQVVAAATRTANKGTLLRDLFLRADEANTARGLRKPTYFEFGAHLAMMSATAAPSWFQAGHAQFEFSFPPVHRWGWRDVPWPPMPRYAGNGTLFSVPRT